MYTFTANFHGSIVVERDNIVVDGGGYTLRGAGIGNGADLSERKNVTLKNLKITQFAIGIYIYDYSNSGNNTITGNNVVNCGYGLYMDGSHNNTIIGNAFNNNDCGVFTIASHFNVFKNNQLSDNQRNLVVQGGYLAALAQYMDTSNTMNGKPIYYWIEERDKTVPPDAGYVALIGCENIKVQDLKLTGNGQGILLFSTKDSTITRNIIKDNDVGIFVSDSLDITLYENVIASNNIGIRIVGVFPAYSHNNRIYENNITNNYVGIYIFDSSNNTIYRNHIANNGNGIYIEWGGGSNNNIYHNNFINNTAEAPGTWHTVVFHEIWMPPPANVWDSGKEGNYWSYYITRYPNATEIDGSGIWDTPYVISENNQDNYPLTNPVAIPESSDEEPPPSKQPGFLGSSLPMEYGYAIITIIVMAIATVAFVVYFRKIRETTENRKDNTQGRRLKATVIVLVSIILFSSFAANIQLSSATEDSWTTLAEMPTPREGLGVAVVNGKIYAIGGHDGNGNLDVNEEYEPATNIWTTKNSMPTSRSRFGITVHQNKIYVMGGSTDSGFTGANEVYDPVTDTWETRASMPAGGRSELAVNAVNGKIYAIDGYFIGVYWVPSNLTEVYDPATNTWTPKAPLLNAMCAPLPPCVHAHLCVGDI